MSHVTRNTSHLTRHTSPVTHNMRVPFSQTAHVASESRRGGGGWRVPPGQAAPALQPTNPKGVIGTERGGWAGGLKGTWFF